MRPEAKLNTRMVALADRCKRDLIVMLAKGGTHPLGEVGVAQLQVIVGMAIRSAVLMGRSFERWNATQPLALEEPKPPPRAATPAMIRPARIPEAPRRVDDSPQAWDDTTTEVMPPRKEWP